MPADTVYTLINGAIVPFWLLLLIFPHAKPTQLLVHSGLIPVIYGFVYVFYLGSSLLMGAPEGASMGSLEGLLIALSDPQGVIGAWTHYLIFDLFVGAWMVRDAKRQEIHHLAVVIPVALTFMAGPFGLLLYIGLRGIWKKRFTLLEEDEEPKTA
jgi:hypothetical protein